MPTRLRLKHNILVGGVVLKRGTAVHSWRIPAQLQTTRYVEVVDCQSTLRPYPLVVILVVHPFTVLVRIGTAFVDPDCVLSLLGTDHLKNTGTTNRDVRSVVRGEPKH
jgi:hypothetical protein